MKNYIKKELIKSLIKNRNSFLEILAPMGSGKTRATIEVASEYVKQNKKVLILTPYITSANEYRRAFENNKTIYFDAFFDIGNFLKDNNNIIIDYILRTIDFGIEVVKSKLNNKESDVILNELKKVYDEFLSNFDLIILDEVDFSSIQAFMTKDISVFDTSDYILITRQHCLILFFLALKNKKSFSISANKLRIPPKVKNSVAHLVGSELVFDTHILNLKSNLKIKSITNIYTNGLNNVEKNRFIKSVIWTFTKSNCITLFFKSGKWTKGYASIFKKTNVLVLSRKENASYSLSKDKLMRPIFDVNDLELIGESDNSILCDAIIENRKHIAINTSSSRAVSLNNEYKDKKVSIVIFSDNITETVTQVMGRFRNAEVDIYIISDLMLHKLDDHIKSVDRFLLNQLWCDIELKNISAADAKNKGIIEPYNHKNTGKNRSKESIFIDFVSSNERRESIAKYYERYKEYAKDNAYSFSSFKNKLRKLNKGE